MDTLLRQWAMLRLIPRSPRKIDTAALKSGLGDLGYEVNVRTIQRDLNKLSNALPLVCDQSKPQGWSWHADSELFDMPALSPQSALVFKMVEQHLSRVLPSTTLATLSPWFKTANGVLESQGGNAGKWLDKVRIIPRGQALLPPTINPEVQEVVYEALFSGKKLIANYRPHQASEYRNYEVSPLAIVQRDHLTYVVCTLGSSSDTRNLVLHRFRSAQLLDTPLQTPNGFDLDAYIAGGGLGYQVGSTIRLEAEVSLSVASILKETPISPDQTLEKMETGMFRMTASVADTKELRAWLRGYGRHIRVIGPSNFYRNQQELKSELKSSGLKKDGN